MFSAGCVAVCAAVHAGAVARRAGSGLLKPAEWLAWMRVLKPFLHVSACPDVLLCADCVLVGCVTVIGWSVGVVWVSRHEQGRGGGLYLVYSSSATITSSTISGNSAVSFACAPLGALCCLC